MSAAIATTLLALEDVHGVQGSFVLGIDGALIAMAMPPLFEASMLAELGPRIERLAESFATLGDELDSCLIRFTDYMLCIKRFAKGGVLCILTDSSINLPALKMAVNLADRRMANEIASAPAFSLTPVVAAPAASPAAPAPAAQPSAAGGPERNGAQAPERRGPRYYRGHLIED